MNAQLSRIILYVQDVEGLSRFYRDAFALKRVEHIDGEWAVLAAGSSEIALHRVGADHRVADISAWRVKSNAKLVLTVDGDFDVIRASLIAMGVPMGDIKSYPGTGRLCDGRDPEGNVFQIAENGTLSASL